MDIKQLEAFAEQNMRESLATSGEWRTHAVLMADQGVIYFDMGAKNDKEKHQHQQQVKTCIRLARAAGVFQGVIFGSEAWLAKRNKDTMHIPLRPSLDPDRVECAVYSCMTEKARIMKSYVLKRDGKTVTVGESMMDDMTSFESWLDGAFEKLPPEFDTPRFQKAAATLWREGLKFAQQQSTKEAQDGQS